MSVCATRVLFLRWRPRAACLHSQTAGSENKYILYRVFQGKHKQVMAELPGAEITSGWPASCVCFNEQECAARLWSFYQRKIGKGTSKTRRNVDRCVFLDHAVPRKKHRTSFYLAPVAKFTKPYLTGQWKFVYPWDIQYEVRRPRINRGIGM